MDASTVTLLLHDLRAGRHEAFDALLPEAAASEALPSEAGLSGALSGAYPNPFSRSATVGFALPKTQKVRLAVYNVLGREVAVLADGELEAGRHQAALDGSGLPSGVYLVRLVTESRTETQRLTLVR